jgi:hypothetical protein
MSLSEDLDTWTEYGEDDADPAALLEEEEITPSAEGAEEWGFEGEWEATPVGGAVEAEADPLAGTAEEEAADLLGELLAEGFGDDPEAGVDAGTEAASEEVDAELAVEQFSGAEHRQVGDAGSGGVPSSIAYGASGKLLTFGEVVALAGDYFATYDEMRDLARSDQGRSEIAWARWHCLELPKADEPRVAPALKKSAIDRYYLLAGRNISHFSAGGSAWQAYILWHGKAIADALEAGQTSDKAVWRRALTKEAFGDHFLTDMFSAGHVRTPRAAIREWYTRQVPGSTERLLRYMAKFMYDRLDERQQLPTLAWLFSWITKRVMARKIETLGGEAVRSFSLGDIVSLALHDFDNKGLQVVSDVDPNGRRVAAGHKWRALGDSHLHQGVHGANTVKMATAAVTASLRELQRVRDAGAKFGTRTVSLSDRSAAVKRALGGPTFAARGFVPREDRSSPKNVPLVRADGGKSPLEWRWGQLGDVAHGAIDAAVRVRVARELHAKAADVEDPVKASLGMTIHGTRSAYLSFVTHLRTDGIVALENAIGKRSR